MKYILLFVIFLFLATPAYADSLVNDINSQRTSKLTENVKLDKSASIKACDMARNHYWSHLDLQGRMSWHLIREQGYSYVWAGEDMAKGYTNNQEIVNAWLNSPTHKKILLNPVYKEIGIGRCGAFVVAHFGTR